MDDRRQQLAERRLAQTRSVGALIELLRALLAGRMTRAEVEAVSAASRPHASPASGPSGLRDAAVANFELGFDSPCAAAVFEALRRAGDELAVRELELRAYLDALVRGDWFVGDPRPLVRLDLDLDSLNAQLDLGAEPIRWWHPDHGWTRRARFAARASGRPFLAVAYASDESSVDIHKLAGDPWQPALVELFEQLAIDERDTIELDPIVALADLPTWALWREDDNANRFEMERFRSFAKAERFERMYVERGHKQHYWIEPVA